MRLALLSVSALVMPVWSLVFLSHTLLHAIWMVRPFAWFVALAGLLALLARRRSLTRAIAALAKACLAQPCLAKGLGRSVAGDPVRRALPLSCGEHLS